MRNEMVVVVVAAMTLIVGGSVLAQQVDPAPDPLTQAGPPGVTPRGSQSGEPTGDPLAASGDVRFPGGLTTNGDILLDGSTAPFGVLLRANSDTSHSVGVQLGNNASSYFRIFDSGNLPLWSAYSSGIAELTKSQGAPTVLVVNNANPGSSTANAVSGLWFMEGSALKVSIVAANSANTVGTGGANALRILNWADGPIVFSTNSAERFRIGGNGTIRMLSPAGNGQSIEFADTSITDSWTGGISMQMMGQSTIRVSGVQIGRLGGAAVQSTATAGAGALYLNGDSDNDVIVGMSSANRGLIVRSAGPSSFAGSVTVAGEVSAGTIKATYQDVAEWVPSTAALLPGTVVVVDAAHSNHVTASSEEYDTRVAGVVSPRPGLVLGTPGESKAMIAATGRVKVRVDASMGSIAIGDLLVTGNKPGVAMKSVPLEIQGVKMHRPGTVLGKALEPLETGEGEILVLLSLQ